ncbi:MAG: response regulator transcription factor [Anaerolineaceae bacterium]
MHAPVADHRYTGLPPLVGLQIAVIATELERSYDRARGLEGFGYRVTACGDPAAALRQITESKPDAVIVDLGRDLSFPAETVTCLRTVSSAPLLVVGCAGTAVEMLRCFESGADDYCRPRCSTEEIDLRLRALFRRISNSGRQRLSHSPPTVRVGEIEIDPAGQTVRKAGISIPLSPTEFRLLSALAEHPGEVIPSKALIARVWGNEYSGETHYLRLYIRYLRQKLEVDPSHPRYIVNRWGSGYALDDGSRAARDLAS